MKTKIHPLDKLFSEFIRKRAIKESGGCQRCLSQKYDTEKEDGSLFPAWKQLDCAHFHDRRERSVRFDEDNAIGACGACHIFLDNHPLEKVEYFRERLGTNFDLLNSRRRFTGKIDRQALTLYYKQKIKEMDDAKRK